MGNFENNPIVEIPKTVMEKAKGAIGSMVEGLSGNRLLDNKKKEQYEQ